MGRRGKRVDRRGRPRIRGTARRILVGTLPLIIILAVFLALPAPSSRGQVSRAITMGDIFFEPGTFAANPGDNVTLRLVNGGVLPHTFTLFEEANVSVPVNDPNALREFHSRSQPLVDISLDGGQEASVNFTVPATVGLYTFVCMVPGHAAQGMHGLMFVGVEPGDGGLFGGIGIVQGIFLSALVGVLVFAVPYHVRSTRS